ncbi:hypothetical protein JWG39_11275 [Desulforhopalus vacuolatus]|uniref:hypothetical protein n=1 Tax=Desulforhopalus vacuolatus TaxID=40414 RepID=UPI001964C057|nr:hypothetical protein [Desulforhopalus vacuolatus]MBM9520393.1 hypothetical protein [Desulforhopalus vacuolatus]
MRSIKMYKQWFMRLPQLAGLSWTELHEQIYKLKNSYIFDFILAAGKQVSFQKCDEILILHSALLRRLKDIYFLE